MSPQPVKRNSGNRFCGEMSLAMTAVVGGGKPESRIAHHCAIVPKHTPPPTISRADRQVCTIDACGRNLFGVLLLIAFFLSGSRSNGGIL